MVNYFAYGSNINKDEMRRKGVNPGKSQRAVLKGWKLKFEKKSDKWDFAANIENTKNPNDVVYGVVYTISDKEFRVIREKEPGYRKEAIETVLENGEPLSSDTFIAIDIVDRRGAITDKLIKYLDVIVNGLRQHEYSEEIIERVKNCL